MKTDGFLRQGNNRTGKTEKNCGREASFPKSLP
jgi:hypothetical protein